MSSKPRRPIVTVMAVEIVCPKCEETIKSPEGNYSYFWTSDELTNWKEDKIVCDSCGTVILVPKYASNKVIGQ